MTTPGDPAADTRHSGLVAVVTGASRGIGAGLATHFASRGFRLGLCARSVPKVPVGADVVAEAVDVTDPVAIDSFAAAVVARFGRIDLWVNNAGLLEPIGPLADADPTDLQRHVAVNVLGAALSWRYLPPYKASTKAAQDGAAVYRRILEGTE